MAVLGRLAVPHAIRALFETGHMGVAFGFDLRFRFAFREAVGSGHRRAGIVVMHPLNGGILRAVGRRATALDVRRAATTREAGIRRIFPPVVVEE